MTIKRDGKRILAGNGRDKDNPAAKRTLELARREEKLVEACKIGIPEFIDEKSASLEGIPLLDRIIFLNRVRKTILESMFYSAHKNYHQGNKDSFFDFDIFTEKEREFVIFRMGDLGSCKTWEDTKQFIHDNFKDIRSVKDVEELLEEEKCLKL